MLIKQCQRCYSQNRRVDKPIQVNSFICVILKYLNTCTVQLYLTSVKGKCKERFEQSVSGFKQWELHFKTEGFMSVFNKEEIIFLTAESPNIITGIIIIIHACLLVIIILIVHYRIRQRQSVHHRGSC